MSKPIHSICIVRLSALGDCILLLPLIHSLQKTTPKVEITWVISAACYPLVKTVSGVNFIVIDKPKRLVDYWRFYKKMHSKYFDVLLATQASLRANLLYLGIRAGKKIGFDKARAKDGHRWFIRSSIEKGEDHLLEAFLKFAKAIDIPSTTEYLDLGLLPEEYLTAKSLIPTGRKVIAINPCASKVERNWSQENYITLIQAIKKRYGYNVVITGSPADKAFCAPIIEATNAIDLVGKTPIRILAAFLSMVDLLICPDTGPAHIADCVGTKVIGLYAVAPGKLSAPYHNQAHCIDKFYEAANTFLHKTPDMLVWGTRVHDVRAMSLITVALVLSQLDSVLG